MECVLSLVDRGFEVEALAATLAGDRIHSVTSIGTSNPRFIGRDGLEEKLRGLIAEALAGLPGSVCVASAVALHADPELARDLVAALTPVDRDCVFPGLIEPYALAGSLGTAQPTRGVVIRADIGSRGWAVAGPGRISTRGGYGEVLGDEGSAYWIGREAIRAVLRGYEKRHRSSSLRARLLSHYGLGSYQELLTPEYEPAALDRFRIGSFAPLVSESAEEDDEVAVGILEEAGRDLAAMALALINELELGDAEFSVLPYGSVFRQRGTCLETFMKLLKNRTAKTNLVKEGMGAAAGGVLMAQQELGLQVRPEKVGMLRAALKARD